MEALGAPLQAQAVRGSRVGLIAALVGLAAGAWLGLDRSMGGMDSGQGTAPAALGLYVLVWVVMMAAMMFPSVSPTVAVYDRLRAGHRQRGTGAPVYATAVFVVGYLAVWTLLGLLAFGLLAAGRALSPAALDWDSAGRWVAAGVIAAAAVYQVTPLKEACLVRCRGPLMFLAERWRNGTSGALRLGAAHGAWCVGCCWALMAALFALGVMSLAWMALVAAFIAAEKLLPWPRAPRVAVALILLSLALAVAVAPDRLPGLMMPGEPSMPGGPGTPDMHGGSMP